jgi:hypothetical protein
VELLVLLPNIILREVCGEKLSFRLKVYLLQLDQIIQMGGVLLKQAGRASKSIPDLAFRPETNENYFSERMIFAVARNNWKIRFV